MRGKLEGCNVYVWLLTLKILLFAIYINDPLRNRSSLALGEARASSINVKTSQW